MNENPNTPLGPTSTERTVVVHPTHARLWGLTIASLCLNGLILLLLIVGAVIHHHHKKHMKHDKDHGNRGGGESCGCGGAGEKFQHFGHRGMGWGGGREDHDEGFKDRGGDQGREDKGFDRPGFGDDQRGGDFRHRGMGMGMRGDKRMEKGMGMGDGGKNPPDPAMVTDDILNHLNEQLTLTDDEKAKIKPIILSQVTQMQKDEQAHRDAFMKQMEDGKAKIRPLLNADQQKELDAMPTPGQKAADKPAEPAAKTTT